MKSSGGQLPGGSQLWLGIVIGIAVAIAGYALVKYVQRSQSNANAVMALGVAAATILSLLALFRR